MVILGVYFEQVPSPYDPPNANEFYQALGKAITAWGRLEGNFNHLFITALNIAPDPRVGTRFYIQRALLAKKWTLVFETTQAAHALVGSRKLHPLRHGRTGDASRSLRAWTLGSHFLGGLEDATATSTSKGTATATAHA